MRRENSFGTVLQYVLMVFLVVALGLIVFFNYTANREQMEQLAAEEAAAAVTPTPPPTPTPAPTPAPERVTEVVTLAFAGDIVGQVGLTTDAEAEDGSYDYSEELSGVSTALEGADLAACTLVGTLSERGPFEEGYRMNTAMAAAITGAGFGVVNAATDHILDDGLEGLTETAEALYSAGLVTVGAYRSESTHGIFLAEIGGVKVAVLAYTCGTGGVSAAEAPWSVDILTQDYMTGQQTVDYDRVDADIAAAREAGADIVACFVYWWEDTQYYTNPRESQTAVAERLFADGVDILIGGGVKTPQPIETYTVERADGTAANCVACYSLSNLMSCYNDIYTNLSAVVKIEVSRDTDSGEIWVSGVRCEPLFMLDTDDYPDYVSPSFKYRLLDARSAMAAYEEGGTEISAATFEAIEAGISDLFGILGDAYDSVTEGVLLPFPGVS